MTSAAAKLAVPAASTSMLKRIGSAGMRPRFTGFNDADAAKVALLRDGFTRFGILSRHIGTDIAVVIFSSSGVD